MGGHRALRQMFEEYKFGGTVPKNEVIADQYLHKAAHHGSEWAILLLAQLEEKSAPATAIASYLRLARNDNCIAQMRLAEAYASGVLVKKNLTQAYFWLLLAKVNQWVRKADVNYNRAAGMSYEAGYKQCGMAALNLLPLEIQIEAKKLLPATLMQTAQAAASDWTKGGAEQLLPAPVITATQDGKPDAKSNGRREVAAIAPRFGTRNLSTVGCN